MKKLQTEQNLKRDKFSTILMVGLFMVVAILAGCRVVAANRLVETSQNLRNLDNEVTTLEKQNQILSQEVREAQSITNIENRVTALGFVNTTKYAYVAKPSGLAFRLQ